MTKLTAQEWGLHIWQKVKEKDGDIFVLRGIDIFLEHIELSSYGIFCNKQKYESDCCKPVLRDLSQMTEDEKKEFADIFLCIDECDRFELTVDYKTLYFNLVCVDINGMESKPIVQQIKAIDWLTRKGFAIRGEFERGVAVREGER